MPVRLPRLEALLGTVLADAQAEHIARLVDGRVPEDTDLEFKQELYGNGMQAHRDLATDVVALANTAGGALVIGIGEGEERGRAAELRPVAFSGGESIRIRQIVASYAAPPPSFDIVHVPNGEADGFVLLVVPPSPIRPHAVRIDDDKLKYPVRDGPRIRYLFEHEVAAAYGDRFERAAGRDVRLEATMSEGLGRLDREEAVWLCLALVPEVAGVMEITRRAVSEAQGFAAGFGRPYLGFEAWADTEIKVDVDVRRITLSGGRDQESGRAIYTYAELHTDGSGFIAKPLWIEGLGSSEGGPKISDQRLVETMASLVRFLADQAARTGASGSALAASTIVGAQPVELVGLFQGMLERVTGSHPLAAEVVSRRTVDLDAIRGEPRELAHVTRTLLAELLQGFGVPESVHITPEGELRTRAFSRRGRSVGWDIWAGGFPTVDTPLVE